MKKIIVSTTSFGEYDGSYIKECEKRGFEVVLNPHGRKVTGDELIDLAGDAVGLIAGTEDLSGEVLREAGTLRGGSPSVDGRIFSRSGIENLTDVTHIGLDRVPAQPEDHFDPAGDQRPVEGGVHRFVPGVPSASGMNIRPWYCSAGGN